MAKDALLFSNWLVLFLILSVSSCSADITLVNTTGGQVFGAVDNNIKIWRGIPFAVPPTGKLRYLIYYHSFYLFKRIRSKLVLQEEGSRGKRGEGREE